ncbi:MAG: glucose-1-phosphate adenylyltransferase [Chitinivibrionales bacterium]|nr:glucose-1-phosphate adenylyltransferase [Chitinivibrionales bacterium]MBD3356320.1 glucose-1-phosphate adenylyltransferase [Chitinivibrionales bacterium]
MTKRIPKVNFETGSRYKRRRTRHGGRMMIYPKDIVVVILGGGKGTRLYPLTQKRAKPAVNFGGKYRLIDVPVTNCLASQLNRIFILTQFNSFSLNRHVFQAYSREITRDGFVDIIAAEQRHTGGDWFQGTADAVRRTMDYVLYHDPKHILILSGDQMYSMDYQNLLVWHTAHDADVSIAVKCSSADEIAGLGIVKADKDNCVTDFYEKPKDVSKVADFRQCGEGLCPPERPFLASMGIYLFDTDVLLDVLDSDEMDFGKAIIPMAAQKNRMICFPFDGYWEDVGSIEAFYKANMDWRSGMGISAMFNEGNSIVTHSRQLAPTRIDGTHISGSIIADGGNIHAARVSNSVVGTRTRIGPDTIVEDSIIMGNDRHRANGSFEIGSSCRIRKAIIDRNVVVEDGVRIENREGIQEAENERFVIRSGIVVIPQDATIPAGTII